eukprot:TRINITY_DN60174_c0_g1_i1.p1 TRINITY_DN60174_c0_g1~~TRINITY_DN60174_c0_g1_i1.p1  ORF type:complete len:336 (-),score=10.61 TRINITY_DN60174_c0_g1_i1:125-1132(-)
MFPKARSQRISSVLIAAALLCVMCRFLFQGDRAFLSLGSASRTRYFRPGGCRRTAVALQAQGQADDEQGHVAMWNISTHEALEKYLVGSADVVELSLRLSAMEHRIQELVGEVEASERMERQDFEQRFESHPELFQGRQLTPLGPKESAWFHELLDRSLKESLASQNGVDNPGDELRRLEALLWKATHRLWYAWTCVCSPRGPLALGTLNELEQQGILSEVMFCQENRCGPDHEPSFSIRLNATLNAATQYALSAVGYGGSKKCAKHDAAKRIFRCVLPHLLRSGTATNTQLEGKVLAHLRTNMLQDDAHSELMPLAMHFHWAHFARARRPPAPS